MTRDDIRKLLGGYATDSLTEAERKILFDAALDDQDLFDELAQEQALKEALEEPGAKQRLIAALAPRPTVLPKAWWARPWPWVAAAAAVVIVVGVSLRPPTERKEVAEVRIPAPSLDAPPVTIPVQPREAAPSAQGQQGRRQAPALVPPAALRKEVSPPALQNSVSSPDSVSNKDSVSNQPQQPKAEAVEVAPAGAVVAAPRAAAPVAPPAPAPAAPADALAVPGALSFRAQEARAPEAAAAARGGGGGRGGRGGAQQGQAGAIASLAPSAVAKTAGSTIGRFAFDYSVTPEGRLRIVPASDGFLTVSVSNGDTSQVLSSDRPILASSPVELLLPNDSALATIIFARTAGAVASAGAAPAAFGGAIDPPSGTKADTVPSSNSPLRAIIQLPPRR